MKNLRFEITEQQIINYINKYKEYYNNCEAMFIKYLKDNSGILTEEMLEILTNEKINIENKGELLSFDTKPIDIKKMDLSGICHIMIPCIRYYGQTEFNHSEYRSKLNSISEQLGCNSQKLNSDVLLDTIDNYTIVGQLMKYRPPIYFSSFTISREKAKNIIDEYIYVYGEEPVEKIKMLVKE